MRRLKDGLAWALAILALALIIVGPIAAHVFAPCDWVDWMPTKNVPGRCLPGGRG